LWRLIRQAGFEADFVGSNDSHGPADSFDLDNEGHSGFRTTDILDGLPAWLASSAPDVVLLHIGTNDILECWGSAIPAENIKKIIDLVQRYNRNVIVILAKIVPLGGHTLDFNDRYCGDGERLDQTVMALNDQLALLAASNAGVVLVDLYAILNADTDLRDGIHPNEIGQQKIAAAWFAALKPVLESNPRTRLAK
jgi:acyl-CoA thioesterase I